MSVGDIPAIGWPWVTLLELVAGPLETKELGWSVFYVYWRHSRYLLALCNVVGANSRSVGDQGA